MANIEDFKAWISKDLIATDSILILSESKNKLCLVFYTYTNSYHITAAKTGKDKWFLSCHSDCRKPRPGEDWTRGNDINDGEFTLDTWRGILSGIVRHEIQGLSRTKSLLTLAGQVAEDRAFPHPEE